MTDTNPIQVPKNLLSLLKGHISNQEDAFLLGFCSLLTYQYPESQFSSFYESNVDSDDFFIEPFEQDKLSFFLAELIQRLNSGSSAVSSSVPVKGGDNL